MSFAQTNKYKKQPSLGFNFFLQDFKTPATIASGSLSAALNNKNWAKMKDMQAGLSLQFMQGLTDHIDFSTTLGGAFVNYPFRSVSGISSVGQNTFLLEADAGVNIKLLTDNYFMVPYLNVGLGASMNAGTYFAAYLPIGGGLQFNLGEGSFLNTQFNFRSEVSGLSTRHINYSIGFSAPLKDRKPEPVVVAPPPPPPPAPAPVDTDGDGIFDNVDKCVTVPGVAKYQGCPVPDTDGDGINDDNDKCPTVKGIAKYDGCPIPDTDKDGINDEEDKCPSVPGLARFQGCPIPDTDGDGINDEEDKCPNVKGVRSDNNGCPALNFESKDISFAINSANLTKPSKKELDKGLVILKENPSLKLTIEGHASSTGTDKINDPLSVKRATTVKNYIVSKGIEKDRLSVVGFGSKKPIADNNTPEGRQANRRVEFKVQQ
jgi:outer membrane protein OmpA-like peptidoglycan-associated protein